MPGLYTGTGKFEFDERFLPCVVDAGSLAAADPRREIDDDDVVTAIASMSNNMQCRFSLSLSREGAPSNSFESSRSTRAWKIHKN